MSTVMLHAALACCLPCFAIREGDLIELILDSFMPSLARQCPVAWERGYINRVGGATQAAQAMA